MSLKTLNSCVLVVLVLTFAAPVLPEKRAGINERLTEESAGIPIRSLWRHPPAISSQNLFYGAGGATKRPGKTFRFVKEDTSGSNPKFVIEDEKGVRWKVKLGAEAQPEIAASRIVWAVGYHTDIEYLVPVLRVAGLPGRLSRGAELVRSDGSVSNARLEREQEGKKIGVWHWREAPFRGTREFDGLRVLMALIDNWDLKDENNSVYEHKGARIYEVSDLGASFGATGVLVNKNRAKGNVDSFERSKFLTKVTGQTVSFATPSVPSVPYLFTVWDYNQRVRLRWIGRDIRRPHARWMGTLLNQLSSRQIKDAFRGAGYSEPEIDGFTSVLLERIRTLNKL